ncbi:MAG: hypothetical protein ACE369_11180 [Roseovarius sp.]
MKPTSLLTAAALTVAALPALACPGAADLEKGVVFETQDGTVETHRRVTEDMVIIRTEFGEGEGSILETRHGLYLGSSTPIEGGVVRMAEKEVFASHADLKLWDAPKPDTEWRNDSSGGGTAKAGPQGTIRLGPCAYAAFPVELTFNDDPDYVEQYQYLPDLGVGLLVASTTNEDEEHYTYTDVRPVP